MSAKTIETRFSTAYSPETSAIESYTLKRFHPRKVMFDIVAVMWAVYFLWNQDWQRAALAFIGVSILGLISVLNADPVKMSQTTLGKIGLLHLHPFNIVVQLISLVPLVYGIWMHAPQYILGGLSLLFLGHIYGWNCVDPNYSTEADRGIL